MALALTAAAVALVPGTSASASGFFDAVVTDSACGACAVSFDGADALAATVAGASDDRDTAYAVKDFGGPSGVAGRVFVRTLIGLAAGQQPSANLAVFQVRDAADALVYELYVAADRSLRLYSPPGGLRATGLNKTTGVLVPNDGSTTIRVEVAALANSFVTVLVDQFGTLAFTGLSGATTGNQRYLLAGIHGYAGQTSTPITVTHRAVAFSTAAWLGSPAGPPPDITDLPAVLGTAQEGQTLQAWPGNWTGADAFSYIWRRCNSAGVFCEEIPGATGETHTLVAADVGSRIQLTVTASNDGGIATAVAPQTDVVAAAPIQPANLVPPPISGVAEKGQTLTASVGEWSNDPAWFTLQWQRCDAVGSACTDVGGQTAHSYVLGTADVGATIRVRVTATNGGGSASAASAPTALVAGLAGSFFGSIFTDAGCIGCRVAASLVGTVSAAIQGGFDGRDTAYALKDMSGAFGVPGPGVAGRVYVRTLVGLAAGQAVNGNLALFQVRDVADALVYELYVSSDRTLWLYSPSGGLRATALKKSAGVKVPNDGASIRVEVSALANSSITVRVDDVDKIALDGLSGATTDKQRYLRVGIDHYDTSNTDQPVSVAHTAVAIGTAGWIGPPGGTPPPSAPENVTPPAITGTAIPGETLWATNGTWTNGLGSYAQQWLRCNSAGAACVEIAGETSSAHLVTSADLGFALRIRVTATNPAGTTAALSAPTALVTAPTSPPVSTEPPRVVGLPTLEPGDTLVAAGGSWSNGPTSFDFQWRRCDTAGANCADIAGATADVYAVTRADVGSRIVVQETARNAGGATSTSSAPTAIVSDGFYDAGVVDLPGCRGFACTIHVNGSTLSAGIEGGQDHVDTAYALKDFGGPAGLAGRVYVRTVLGLAAGQQPNANVSVLQVRDAADRLVYELFLNPNRVLRLYSPAGGLRSTAVGIGTGVTVPNDGSSTVRVEVSALANGSVIVRVDGVDRATINGLSGATTGNQRYFRVGIDHYDAQTPLNDDVDVTHASVGLSQSGWLGAP